MASVNSISLRVVPDVPTAGQATVTVDWVIQGSSADAQSHTEYEEFVELIGNGNHIGGDVEFPKQIVVFDGSLLPMSRTVERFTTLDKLRQGAGAGPLQDVSIVARVALTPVWPRRDSDAYKLQATTHP